MNQTFNQSIKRALDELMTSNKKLLLLGLGISDPKCFFMTTENLFQKYGSKRVIECPTSENAYLGHAFGLTLGGFSTIVHFQRMDFMLYAFDQLINNIAKWNYMFGTKLNLPIVIRTLIGRGWGQGAQHSQNLSSVLAQFPGLNIVTPSCPASAYSLLMTSMQQKKPTIFIEHRWLQFLQQKSKVTMSFKIGEALIRKNGTKATVVAWSYTVVEALRFLELYPEADFELIDMVSISPLDIKTIITSFMKTKNLIIWEPAYSFGGIGSEIIASIKERKLSGNVSRLGYPHSYPSSSSKKITNFHPTLEKIVDFFNIQLKMSLKSTKDNQWPIDQDISNWSPWEKQK